MLASVPPDPDADLETEDSTFEDLLLIMGRSDLTGPQLQALRGREIRALAALTRHPDHSGMVLTDLRILPLDRDRRTRKRWALG